MDTGASDFFSRERLAGCDPFVMANAKVFVAGAGAIANNVALDLASMGLGELWTADFDRVEPSNLPRSPMFLRERCESATHPRWKARELSLGFLARSFFGPARARYAVGSMEGIGLGALRQANAIVSAVDSAEGRAYLTDVACLLGKPFIEVGMRAHRGQLSVYPNDATDAPCWRCQHPSIPKGRAPCELYAKHLIDQGFTPATQCTAAVLGGFVADAIASALHGRFPLRNKVLHVDVSTGKTHVFEITPSTDCPGFHRSFGEIAKLDVKAREPLAKVFDAIKGIVKSPVLHLPMPVTHEMPCGRCGAQVKVGKPSWAIERVPECTLCMESKNDNPRFVIVNTVRPNEEAARRSCRSLGLGPLSVFEVEDAMTHELHAFELQGTVDEILTTVERRPAAKPGSDEKSNEEPQEAKAGDATIA